MKKKIPLYYIEWEDAVGDSEWAKPEEVRKENLALVREVGWLIEDTGKVVKLASQICNNGDYGNRTIVDKKWIKYKKLLGMRLCTKRRKRGNKRRSKRR